MVLVIKVHLALLHQWRARLLLSLLLLLVSVLRLILGLLMLRLLLVSVLRLILGLLVLRLLLWWTLLLLALRIPRYVRCAASRSHHARGPIIKFRCAASRSHHARGPIIEGV